jgi:hypothetical protein
VDWGGRPNPADLFIFFLAEMFFFLEPAKERKFRSEIVIPYKYTSYTPFDSQSSCNSKGLFG